MSAVLNRPIYFSMLGRPYRATSARIHLLCMNLFVHIYIDIQTYIFMYNHIYEHVEEHRGVQIKGPRTSRSGGPYF